VGERSARPEDVIATAAAPRSVRIEAIGVDAPIVGVGVRPDTNELDIPGDGDVVVWFRDGARPGEDGSAVLAAHVDWARRPAAFYDLVELPLGSAVVVAAEDGVEHRFVVSARRSYPKGELPLDVFRRRGPSVLTLITCGGSFDDEARSYRENVVVEAVPA
jgi:hypothetical protein